MIIIYRSMNYYLFVYYNRVTSPSLQTSESSFTNETSVLSICWLTLLREHPIRVLVHIARKRQRNHR